MSEGYTVTIGGSQGANPTLGELHQKAVPADQIKSVLRDILIEQFGATAKT
jgi:ferredoxin-nitrite reductase